MTKRTHPVKRDTLRPYRLWDAKARADVPHRYYRWPINAHQTALTMCGPLGYAKVGTCIEVYDATNGTLIGQYTRAVGAVRFVRVRPDYGR